MPLLSASEENRERSQGGVHAHQVSWAPRITRAPRTCCKVMQCPDWYVLCPVGIQSLTTCCFRELSTPACTQTSLRLANTMRRFHHGTCVTPGVVGISERTETLSFPPPFCARVTFSVDVSRSLALSPSSLSSPSISCNMQSRSGGVLDEGEAAALLRRRREEGRRFCPGQRGMCVAQHAPS